MNTNTTSLWGHSQASISLVAAVIRPGGRFCRRRPTVVIDKADFVQERSAASGLWASFLRRIIPFQCSVARHKKGCNVRVNRGPSYTASHERGPRRAEIWHYDPRMPARNTTYRGRENQMLGFVPQGDVECHW